MEKDWYSIEGYHCTLKQAIKQLQDIAKNIGEDRPCYYALATFQDVMRLDKTSILPMDIAEDVVNDMWYYNEVRNAIRRVIDNEIGLQLEKRGLTLDDFKDNY